MENFRNYVNEYLEETKQITQTVDQTAIANMISEMSALRDRQGRLFILGVGGSAGNASHAVNDFRKIANIEAYAPTDNVSELTARVNDESWDDVFSNWLKVSKLNEKDALLVFSVGGGSASASLNLVRAMELAKARDAKIFSIVSRNGGAARELSNVCVMIPVVHDSRITPHAEGWQGVVWHMVVNALYWKQ